MKTEKVWVTRDDNTSGWTCFWKQQEVPTMNEGGYFEAEDKCYRKLFVSSSEDFNEMFESLPEKGSCKQYELSLKEIK